jgi:thioredoxin-like negative regulator of GroEL
LKPFGLRLAKVDATREESLAVEYMVNSFPTLVVFRNGFRVGNFDGDRSATPIFEYMMKENDPDWAPPPSQLPSLAEANFTEVVSKKKLALIMFCESSLH